MFELSEIWRTSMQDRETFLQRVRVYTQRDANIWTAIDRLKYAKYWKDKYDEIDSMTKESGAAILGADGMHDFSLMLRFYTQVADILRTFADTLQPRTFEELERYGFTDSPH
jgi:phage terminase large subunit-like protein